MSRLFRPDGVKNIAVTKLTCDLVWQIGRAAATILDLHTGEPPEFLIGKDTRNSSDILEAALCAGICSAGGNAVQLGIVPTPALAYLTGMQKADAGIMISASEKSAEYNGIRIFSRNGLHMSERLLEEIESLILYKPEQMALYSGRKLGRISGMPDGRERYLQHLQNCVPGRLDGLNIAVDCANGAASETACDFYTRLGAEVTLLNAKPDGMNINLNCGSEHVPKLMDFIAEHPEFDAGLAFDGSGERCIAVDENGTLTDGDRILAVLAEDYQQQGKLKHDALVLTPVSNLGLADFLKERQIQKITSNVGDRFVLEQMRENGCMLGGEPNGHILFLEDAPTGDGQLTGAKLLEIMHRRQQKLSTLSAGMRSYPAVMTSVSIPEYCRENWKNDIQITDLIEKQEALLGTSGRLLVRESGSESLIRILAEGRDFHQMNQIVTEIADKIRERIAESS